MEETYKTRRLCHFCGTLLEVRFWRVEPFKDEIWSCQAELVCQNHGIAAVRSIIGTVDEITHWKMAVADVFRPEFMEPLVDDSRFFSTLPPK